MLLKAPHVRGGVWVSKAEGRGEEMLLLLLLPDDNYRPLNKSQHIKPNPSIYIISYMHKNVSAFPSIKVFLPKWFVPAEGLPSHVVRMSDNLGGNLKERKIVELFWD